MLHKVPNAQILKYSQMSAIVLESKYSNNQCDSEAFFGIPCK